MDDTRISPPPPASPPHPTPATPPPPDPVIPPRLVRPRGDRVIAGVASGIARHLGLDPALVRIVFVVLTLAGGSGVLAYLIAWLVIPEAPAGSVEPSHHVAPDASTWRMVAGALLVLVGLSWLVDQLLPNFGRIAWPVALVVIGGAIILAGARR